MGETENILAFPIQRRMRESWRPLFEDVMAHVAACAEYLDGEGRTIEATLRRRLRLVYKTEGMRLTCAMLDLANCVMLLRAWCEEDMPIEECKRKLALLRFRSPRQPPKHVPRSMLPLLATAEALTERAKPIRDLVMGQP